MSPRKWDTQQGQLPSPELSPKNGCDEAPPCTGPLPDTANERANKRPPEPPRRPLLSLGISVLFPPTTQPTTRHDVIREPTACPSPARPRPEQANAGYVPWAWFSRIKLVSNASWEEILRDVCVIVIVAHGGEPGAKVALRNTDTQAQGERQVAVQAASNVQTCHYMRT